MDQLRNLSVDGQIALLFVMLFGVLTIVSVVAGLLALPAYPWTGIALLGLGYALHKGTVRDEDDFIAVLAVLGALGALAVIGEGLWVEFAPR